MDQNIGSYNQNYGLESGYSYYNNQAGQDYYSQYQSDPRFGRPETNYGFNNQSNNGFNGFDNQHNGFNNQPNNGFNGFDNQYNGFNNQSNNGFNGFDNQCNGFNNQSHNGFYGLDNQFTGYDDPYLEQNRRFNDQSARHYNWNTEQHSFQHGSHHSFQQQDFISNGYNGYDPYTLSTEKETCKYNQTRSEAVAEVVKENPVEDDVLSTRVLESEDLLDKLDLSGWDADSMRRFAEGLEASVEEREKDGPCVDNTSALGRKQLRLLRESAVGKEALKIIYGELDDEFQCYADTNTNKKQVYIADRLRVNYKNKLAQRKRRKGKDDTIVSLNKEVKGLRKKKEKLRKERTGLEKQRKDWAKLLKSKQDLLEKHLESKGVDPALLKKLKHSAPGTERERFIEVIQILK